MADLGRVVGLCSQHSYSNMDRVAEHVWRAACLGCRGYTPLAWVFLRFLPLPACREGKGKKSQKRKETRSPALPTPEGLHQMATHKLSV
jgi:hypothetical protein